MKDTKCNTLFTTLTRLLNCHENLNIVWMAINPTDSGKGLNCFFRHRNILISLFTTPHLKLCFAIGLRQIVLWGIFWFRQVLFYRWHVLSLFNFCAYISSMQFFHPSRDISKFVFGMFANLLKYCPYSFDGKC